MNRSTNVPTNVEGLIQYHEEPTRNVGNSEGRSTPGVNVENPRGIRQPVTTWQAALLTSSRLADDAGAGRWWTTIRSMCNTVLVTPCSCGREIIVAFVY